LIYFICLKELLQRNVGVALFFACNFFIEFLGDQVQKLVGVLMLTRIIHAFPITKPNYLLYIAMLKNYFMQKGETIIA